MFNIICFVVNVYIFLYFLVNLSNLWVFNLYISFICERGLFLGLDNVILMIIDGFGLIVWEGWIVVLKFVFWGIVVVVFDFVFFEI